MSHWCCFPLSTRVSQKDPHTKNRRFPELHRYLFIVVPKEAPSVTNIVWAPSVAPSMAPSVAPSVIVSLICFPVPPPIFEIVSLHPDFRLA